VQQLATLVSQHTLDHMTVKVIVKRFVLFAVFWLSKVWVINYFKINITFLVKLEINSTDIYKMLQQIYGEGTMSRTQVFMLFKKIQDEREDITDGKRFGCATI
jgi:hypothetical protein